MLVQLQVTTAGPKGLILWLSKVSNRCMAETGRKPALGTLVNTAQLEHAHDHTLMWAMLQIQRFRALASALGCRACAWNTPLACGMMARLAAWEGLAGFVNGPMHQSFIPCVSGPICKNFGRRFGTIGDHFCIILVVLGCG